MLTEHGRQVPLQLGWSDLAHPVVPRDPSERQSRLGQFMTPPHVAAFMASLFDPLVVGEASILDPGAGGGTLSSALLHRVSHESADPATVVAYELDPELAAKYSSNVLGSLEPGRISGELREEDFIRSATSLVMQGAQPFSHVIMNPPYRKMNSNSAHRLMLRSVGIETVNLYSAFMALGIELLANRGQLVAIVPRSFCNGPYYRPLRQLILKRTSIRHIHLFDSRDKAFRDDGVLQENVIVHLERNAPQGEVVVSTSTDDRFDNLRSTSYPFSEIVFADDPECFFHVPTETITRSHRAFSGLTHRLEDLDLAVSTGPVVDFRLRDDLRDVFDDGLAPLLYPSHTAREQLTWPIPGGKKPNAIAVTDKSLKWLYPTGNYAVVRRFSAKEEPRRIVATYVDEASFPSTSWLGFENHLNVFHRRRQGLSRTLALGIATLLNSSAFEEMFRRFNGHTQVNATDLRAMRYPSLQILQGLGEFVARSEGLTPEQRDELVEVAIS